MSWSFEGLEERRRWVSYWGDDTSFSNTNVMLEEGARTGRLLKPVQNAGSWRCLVIRNTSVFPGS